MAHTLAVLTGGKQARRTKLTDFLLRWTEPRKRRQTPEEQISIFRALARKQETNVDHR